jgi:hypothetical protein
MVIEIILIALYIGGLIFWYFTNKQYEKHMRMILECMEKERKLYQIISDKVQYDFQKAIEEGKIRILRDDEDN